MRIYRHLKAATRGILSWLGAVTALSVVVSCRPADSARDDPSLPRELSLAQPWALPRVEPDSGYPLRVVDSRSGLAPVSIATAPQRVLLANAYLVDVVSVLIPSDRVVALPEQAMTWTRLVEFDDGFHEKALFRTIDFEKVLRFAPDLVLCSPFNGELVDGLRDRLELPAVVLPDPRTLDELHASIALLGRLLGAADAAAELIADLELREKRMAESIGQRRGLTAVTYSNFGNTGWTAGAGTMADQMLRLAGLRNLAADQLGKQGHERMTFEDLLACDPDVIVFAFRFGEASSGTEAVLRSEPSLSSLSAVQRQRFVALHPRYFSTTSQEVMRGAEEIAGQVNAMVESSPARTERGR